MTFINKGFGYLTGVASAIGNLRLLMYILLSLLLVTSIAMYMSNLKVAIAEVEILELTKAEAIEVLNDRIPNAQSEALVGKFNVGEFMIGHMTSYLPPHSYSPVYMNSEVRFDVAKNKTERGCVLSIAAVSIIGQELTPPLRIGICFNGLTIKLYFKKMPV